MAALTDLTVDCRRPAALARFWADALDGYAVRAYDDEEIERLAAMGRTPETDPTVLVDGPGPSICFQEVPEGKTVKNRMHMDISATGDHAAEVERLVALGASIHYEGDRWTTMLDPEGNEFCVMKR